MAQMYYDLVVMRGPLVMIVLASACGSKAADEAPAAKGPVYTPGVANAVRALAPECALQKSKTGGTVDCKGPYGTALVTHDGANRLRSIDIELRSMTGPEAKVQIANGLRPLLADNLAKVDEIIDRMELGQSETAKFDALTFLIAAAGKSKLAPTWSVKLSW